MDKLHDLFSFYNSISVQRVHLDSETQISWKQKKGRKTFHPCINQKRPEVTIVTEKQTKKKTQTDFMSKFLERVNWSID